MDGHPRQNPAYRPATETPATRGSPFVKRLSLSSHPASSPPAVWETQLARPQKGADAGLHLRPDCSALAAVGGGADVDLHAVGRSRLWPGHLADPGYSFPPADDAPLRDPLEHGWARRDRVGMDLRHLRAARRPDLVRRRRQVEAEPRLLTGCRADPAPSGSRSARVRR